jgi:hypothetical protein
MPKLKTPKKPEERIPVFTWGFKSSKAPLVGGVTFDYVAQLNQDGTVSCNCPGWRFVKKGQPRRCRHTDAVQNEVPEIMSAWRDGKTFEMKEYSAPQIAATVTADVTTTKKPKQQGTLKFNRVVEI